jgi:hypothetical protein
LREVVAASGWCTSAPTGTIKLGTPSSPQHTASPLRMHERERSAATASTISEKRWGEVETVAGEEPHPVAVLARNDPEAVLDFVQPRILGGSSAGVLTGLNRATGSHTLPRLGRVAGVPGYRTDRDARDLAGVLRFQHTKAPD